MDEEHFPKDRQAEIHSLLQTAEEKLQQTSQEVAERAFNLAISVGILPAILIMIAVFLLLKGSLPALIITGILVAILLILFASLVVNISRQRSLERIFEEQVRPEMLREMDVGEISKAELAQLIASQVPEGALISNFLMEPPTRDNQRASDSSPGA